jgi:SAM-dependent methyltransferase
MNSMSAPQSDKKFTGYIPDIYERFFVPLLFAPYAPDLAQRVPAVVTSVLEVAAGTGVVTRALDATLPEKVSVTATDLNQSMLDRAAAETPPRRHIEWRQADAMKLPFEDARFDSVVCQFGVMFFPDKPTAFGEAHRVLRPGGTFIFNVWDRIEENELSAIVMDVMAKVFPDNPASFFARTPHGYHDRRTIERDLAAGGFAAAPEFETLAKRSRANSARHAAIAFCQGSPLRNEIDERDPAALGPATDAVEAAIAERFGAGPVDAKMQAHVITIRK